MQSVTQAGQLIAASQLLSHPLHDELADLLLKQNGGRPGNRQNNQQPDPDPLHHCLHLLFIGINMPINNCKRNCQMQCYHIIVKIKDREIIG
jgi:hypothetical protein